MLIHIEYQAYLVNFSYRKPNGNWISGMNKEVVIPIHELYKANHGEAIKYIKDKYEKCVIHSVVYAD